MRVRRISCRWAVAAMIALMAVPCGPVAAMDLKELENQDQGVQGLVVLRIPFNSAGNPESPRLGVELGLAKDSRSSLEPNSFDTETGQRQIQDDLERVDTFAVDEFLPALPSFGPILPDNEKSN